MGGWRLKVGGWRLEDGRWRMKSENLCPDHKGWIFTWGFSKGWKMRDGRWKVKIFAPALKGGFSLGELLTLLNRSIMPDLWVVI